MGVRRQAGALAVLDLLAEAVELLLAQAALEEGAGVDARRAVALDVDLVAATLVVLAAEEVVEADLVEARRRLVGRDVTADLEALAVGRGHHHRGVPADEGADAALDLLVAGEPRLALRRNGVDVVGGAQRRHADLLLARALEQAQHHVARAVATPVVEHRVEGREPLLGLVGVDVGQLGGESLVDHRHDRRALAGLLGVTHPCIVSRDTPPRNLPAGRRDGGRDDGWDGSRTSGGHDPPGRPAGGTGLRRLLCSGGLCATRAPTGIRAWEALREFDGGRFCPGDRDRRPTGAEARDGRPRARLGQRHR